VNDLRLDLGLGTGADAEELDAAARDLMRELVELDVVVSRPSAGDAPAGARAIELATVGALVVKYGAHALAPLAKVLQGWLARRSGRTIKLTLGADSIEISGGSAAYQRQLIEVFLNAHAGS